MFAICILLILCLKYLKINFYIIIVIILINFILLILYINKVSASGMSIIFKDRITSNYYKILLID